MKSTPTIQSYPKILQLGDRHISTIFDEPVEITEKIDGSQFVFGKIDGEIVARSKGKVMVLDAPDKMFQEAVDYILTVSHAIPEGYIYFAEYLKKPKHNVLSYNKIPSNHIALFGLLRPDNSWYEKHEDLSVAAYNIGVDVVPLLYSGKINDIEEVFALIDLESYLGGPKVEGIVVKNYKEYFIADRLISVMAGKYVSEKFKEKHANDWKAQNTGKGKWEMCVQQFKTEARWRKAIQHLRENGELEETPRDIGNLIKEIHRDIIEEEMESIKNVLWKNFGDQVLRYSIAGFPEWYKENLARGEI